MVGQAKTLGSMGTSVTGLVGLGLARLEVDVATSYPRSDVSSFGRMDIVELSVREASETCSPKKDLRRT
jgi:hypothetical protein